MRKKINPKQVIKVRTSKPTPKGKVNKPVAPKKEAK